MSIVLKKKKKTKKKASQLIPPSVGTERTSRRPKSFSCVARFFFFPTEMSAIYLIAGLELKRCAGLYVSEAKPGCSRPLWVEETNENPLIIDRVEFNPHGLTFRIRFFFFFFCCRVFNSLKAIECLGNASSGGVSHLSCWQLWWIESFTGQHWGLAAGLFG